MLVLVHHYDFHSPKAIHDLINHCQGAMIKEKLTKVIKWVQQTESLLQNVQKVIPRQENINEELEVLGKEEFNKLQLSFESVSIKRFMYCYFFCLHWGNF